MVSIELLPALLLIDMHRYEAFVLGCVLAVLITLFHVTALTEIVSWSDRKFDNIRENKRHPFMASLCFGTTIFLMLFLHIGDSCIWAFILYGLKLIPEIHDALYFAANTYTSLGYGDSLLTRDWRELSPLMAISGLFTFACTTSQLFDVMGKHRKAVAALRTQSAEGLNAG